MADIQNQGYIFRPQPDVTVSELARILQTILTLQQSVFTPTTMTQIPDDCLRHFVTQGQQEYERMLYLGASDV